MASSDSHGESVMLLASAYFVFSYNAGVLFSLTMTPDKVKSGNVKEREKAVDGM